VVGRDEALAALHREVAGHAFEYATGLDVIDGGPAGFLVRVRAGQRLQPATLPDGTTAIDPSIHPGPASPWWVSPVPLVRPTPPGQRQLRRAARSRRGGGVVTLGGSIEFQPDPAPGGQLIVAWREGSETVVQLEQLEYRPSAPRAAIEELVLAGLHAAADAGARVIEHRLDDRDLLQSGLPWKPQDGALRLNATDIPEPHRCRGA